MPNPCAVCNNPADGKLNDKMVSVVNAALNSQ